MSKPRYGWWSYVKDMIRRYPELKAEYKDLHNQTITQQLSGMPGGGGTGRSVEQCAVKELPDIAQREYEAVRRAIELTKKATNGDIRMEVVEIMFWKSGKYTLDGAAMKAHCSYRTARRYHTDFIMTVAKCFGLLDKV